MARTVPVFLVLASDVNSPLTKLAVLRSGGVGLTFPSDPLLALWWIDLSLDPSVGAFAGAAPVRRREEADGDRDSSVEVQIDFCSVQENSSRMPFDVPKGRQEGVSCFFGVKEGEGRERMCYASWLVFPIEKRREGLRWRGEGERLSWVCERSETWRRLNGLMWKNGGEKREESVESQPDKLMVC